MNREQVTHHYLKTRGCTIKRSYLNKKEAKEAAKRMNRKSDAGRIRAYSCQYCENYHIGHIRPSYEDRKETKRIETFLKNTA